MAKNKNKRIRKASFDVIPGSNGSSGSGNKRRKSSVETKGETGKQGILNPFDRLNALNLCRDAVRNYSSAKSIEHQLKVNIIGPSPKIQVNTGDEFGKEVTDWFNTDWAKDCDFRQERRLAKLAQLVVAGRKREGDLLTVFDDNMIKDSGKILFYESDLICDVSGDAADKIKEKKWTQTDGIISDEWGREVGYVTTHRRGMSSVPEADATIWTRDPDDKDANMVKLIREDYRLIQGRGISPMLSAISDFLDCYEMRSKELQSAKVAASMYASVKRKEAETDFDDPRFDPDNENPSDQDDSYDPDASTLPEDQDEPATYEALEKLTGGYTNYLDKEDEIEFPDINRPNVAMKEFLDYVMDQGGSVFGFAHAYTRLKADTSYTAFRGDMILTWVSIYADQKDMEHDFLDWVAVRAIRWNMRKNGFKNEAPEGWEKTISWNLPKIPYIDELKERKAHSEGLKNGELKYSDILGPDWQKHFEQYSKELEAARGLGLPLNVFETKAGAPAEENENENRGNEDE